MATFYSSFFSSGLLHQHSPLPTPPIAADPTTPRAATIPLMDDTTPTASASASAYTVQPDSQTLPTISVVEPASSNGRPQLRRRRSSLTVQTSSIPLIKASTPLRNAAAAQRTHRARSGSDASMLSTGPSIAENPPATAPPTSTSFIGRLRSGSVGTALRPRRTLRRHVAASPAPPPPRAPLPAPPALGSGQSLSPATPSPTGRGPLSRRSHNIVSPLTTTGLSAARGDEEPAMGKRADGMVIDYPSPVEGPSFEWARPGSMKEN